MNKYLEDLLKEIKDLEQKVSDELTSKQEEFKYNIVAGKVIFDKEVSKYNKRFRTKLIPYILGTTFVNLLIIPFIYSMIIPAFILDAFTTVFQFVCFPVYKIPKVDRKEYIVVDRHKLSFLNLLQKVNCVYCGYFNGLILYVREVGSRTEKYWCPIKHASKVNGQHPDYYSYIDYGDAKQFEEKLGKLKKKYTNVKGS